MYTSNLVFIHQALLFVGLILIIVGHSLPGPNDENPDRNINSKFYLKLIGYSLILVYLFMFVYAGFTTYKAIKLNS